MSNSLVVVEHTEIKVNGNVFIRKNLESHFILTIKLSFEMYQQIY